LKLAVEHTFVTLILTSASRAGYTNMGKNIGRVCGLLGSLVVLALGVIGITPFAPRWAWITLGVAGALFIIGEFIYARQRTDSGDSEPKPVQQTQVSGNGSTNNQAGGDINIQPAKTADNP
jgi:hypothetical protein